MILPCLGSPTQLMKTFKAPKKPMQIILLQLCQYEQFRLNMILLGRVFLIDIKKAHYCAFFIIDSGLSFERNRRF